MLSVYHLYIYILKTLYFQCICIVTISTVVAVLYHKLLHGSNIIVRNDIMQLVFIRLKTRRRSRSIWSRFSLPYDDIHDQEVPHQADDADDHVDDHDGDFDAGGQEGVRLVVGTAEVVLIQ